MNSSQAPFALYLELWLVLMASVLVSRRLPVGKLVKMALAWIAILATGFMLFSVLRS